MEKGSGGVYFCGKKIMRQRKEEFRISESYRGGSVEKCVNLLPDIYGRLRSVPLPEITGEGDMEPLFTHNGDDGRRHCFFYSSEPVASGYIIKVVLDGEWKTIGALPGKPRCGFSVNREEVAISDGESITLFSWHDNRWVQRSAGNDGAWCDILRGVSHSTVSAQSGSFEVRTTGDRTVTLSDGAREEIRRRLGSMYESICGVAGNSGLWLQPVVAFVRVLNRNGRVIYKGLPRVIAPSGWQCVDSITSNVTVSDGVVTINDMRAEARGYYMELGFNGELDDEAASVEVVASCQIHPVNPSEESAARLVVHSSGSNVTVAMPGATYNFGKRNGEWGYRIARMCAAVEKTGYVAARIDASAFSGGEKVRINAAPWSLNTELDKQNAGVEGRVSADSATTVMDKINGGARWGAGHCATSGSSVVFADIKVSAPEPPHPLQIAGALTAYEGEWQAVTVVETATGERIAKCFDGEGAWPSTIAPMASCAWSGATVMKLFVELDNGAIYMAEAGLTPDAGGGPLALFLDSSLEGRELEPTDSSLPAESRGSVERYAGMILTSDASAPLVICGERVCGSVVNGLCRSVRSRDSWEVGRARFYAFTPQGVSAVAVSGANNTIGATTICDAVVEHRGGAVVTPAGVYAAGGGRLWYLRGTGAECIEAEFSGIMLGWCGVNEQLWSVDRLGNVQIRKLRGDGRVAWRVDVPLPYTPKSLLDTPEGMIIGSESATLFLGGDAERAEEANVEFVAALTAPRGMRAAELYVDMNGENISGAINLIADGGAGYGEGRIVCSLGIDGSVNEPFSVRLLCDKHHRYTLRVHGTVSPDSYFEKFELIFSK